jgi:hypothetical protein
MSAAVPATAAAPLRQAPVVTFPQDRAVIGHPDRTALWFRRIGENDLRDHVVEHIVLIDRQVSVQAARLDLAGHRALQRGAPVQVRVLTRGLTGIHTENPQDHPAQLSRVRICPGRREVIREQAPVVDADLAPRLRGTDHRQMPFILPLRCL